VSTITTKDGTQIDYKDWGTGQPVVFSHGWPLSADAWEDQMLSLASRGYRCIATIGAVTADRVSPWPGNDMDTYADDLAALVGALDLKAAIHVGHSTGGGRWPVTAVRRADAHPARDDDQIVPIGASAHMSSKLIKRANAESLPGRPARDVLDAQGRDQRRSARVPQGCQLARAPIGDRRASPSPIPRPPTTHRPRSGRLLSPVAA
jgi:pimeloyl-ACP methyl ester carboxylesterase